MDKQSHPQTLGVFAPVGHVIVSFPTQQDMSAAADAMRDAGFADEHITRYTSDQMREQVDIDLAKASPIANLGQEINLARAHGELADQGYSFLVVKAKEEAQWTQVNPDADVTALAWHPAFVKFAGPARNKIGEELGLTDVPVPTESIVDELEHIDRELSQGATSGTAG